jgi:hypothetical protein
MRKQVSSTEEIKMNNTLHFDLNTVWKKCVQVCVYYEEAQTAIILSP